MAPGAPGALAFNCSLWTEFPRALQKYRSAAFDAGLGTRSTTNLTFRMLRRISVNIVDQPGVWAHQCANMQASLPASWAGSPAAAPAAG